MIHVMCQKFEVKARKLSHKDKWDRVFSDLQITDFFICDFSHPSGTTVPDPNVVTEAALAKYHFEKPMIALTQGTPDDVPKDWRGQAFIRYGDQLEELAFLRERLTHHIQRIIHNLNNQ